MKPLREALISNDKRDWAKPHLDLYIISSSNVTALAKAHQNIKNSISISNAVGTRYLIVTEDQLKYAKKNIKGFGKSSYRFYKAFTSDVNKLKSLIKTNISAGFSRFCEVVEEIV
jgi:H2-forming N5,N10-methylenetetrahydromethanopterin dehydrogenase-like enzyme